MKLTTRSTLWLLSFSLLLLFCGCTKENSITFRLFANPMYFAGKVLHDPSDFSSSWVDGESINLNGENCTIAGNGNAASITVENVPSTTIYAIYPNTMSSGGNDIVVTYGAGGTSTMTLKQMAIDFTDATHHKVVLPMAAKTEDNNGRLLFDHLTGGLRFTIENNTGTACTLATVRIVTTGANANAVAPQHHEKGVTVTWERQGLIVPSGPVGSIEDDRTLVYASEMRFAMKTNGTEGVIIPVGGTKTFSVPVTVRSMTGFSVTGYAPGGAELFTKKKSNMNLPIDFNEIYDTPTIKIGTPNE